MAGNGSRSGLTINKALSPLNGKPLFMYSVDIFKKYRCEIILVCKKEEMNEVKMLIPSNVKLVEGGSTRAMSVYNGINKASNDLILIHDAARPFIETSIIDDLLKTMETSKCAYVGIKCKDTARFMDKGVINREHIILAQTPQAGYKNDFIDAMNEAFNDQVILTDDISYLEKYKNYKPTVVNGNELNFKVTTPSDIKIAKAILGGRSND